MSDSTQHTPGKLEQHGVWIFTDVADSAAIAKLEYGGVDSPGFAAAKANARLISAAPDLLESLRAFVSPWDGDSVEEIESQSGLATSVRIEQARAAIAKATGAARATEGSV